MQLFSEEKTREIRRGAHARREPIGRRRRQPAAEDSGVDVSDLLAEMLTA